MLYILLSFSAFFYDNSKSVTSQSHLKQSLCEYLQNGHVNGYLTNWKAFSWNILFFLIYLNESSFYQKKKKKSNVTSLKVLVMRKRDALIQYNFLLLIQTKSDNICFHGLFHTNCLVKHMKTVNSIFVKLTLLFVHLEAQ